MFYGNPTAFNSERVGIKIIIVEWVIKVLLVQRNGSMVLHVQRISPPPASEFFIEGSLWVLTLGS